MNNENNLQKKVQETLAHTLPVGAEVISSRVEMSARGRQNRRMLFIDYKYNGKEHKTSVPLMRNSTKSSWIAQLEKDAMQTDDVELRHAAFSKASARTAIGRRIASAPARRLDNMHLLDGEVLDYGCGRGMDCEALGLVGYDPNHRPNEVALKRLYDTVTCTYVLNTLGHDMEHGIVKAVMKLLKPGGCAYFSVRRGEFKRGWTCKSTFQRDVWLDDYPMCETLHREKNYEIYVMTKPLDDMDWLT